MKTHVIEKQIEKMEEYRKIIDQQATELTQLNEKIEIYEMQQGKLEDLIK